MHFRSLARGREAFRAYRKAGRLDARYLERPYYNYELAGILFELGWPRLAATYYARAIDRGANAHAPAVLADSLLWAGLYADAEATLARYLEQENTEEDAEWRLKKAVLPSIRRFGGDVQVRRVRDAENLAHLNYPHTATLRAALERALTLDACCGEAWFNYALALAVDANDLGAGADAAITGAVLHRTAVGAWSNAILAAGQSPAWRDSIRDLLRMAYRFNGQELVEVLTTPPAFPDAPRPDTDVVRVLNEVVEEAQRLASREGFTLRFFGDDDEGFQLDVVPPARS